MGPPSTPNCAVPSGQGGGYGIALLRAVNRLTARRKMFVVAHIVAHVRARRDEFFSTR